jgi:hypothetical protein
LNLTDELNSKVSKTKEFDSMRYVCYRWTNPTLLSQRRSTEATSSTESRPRCDSNSREIPNLKYIYLRFRPLQRHRARRAPGNELPWMLRYFDSVLYLGKHSSERMHRATGVSALQRPKFLGHLIPTPSLSITHHLEAKDIRHWVQNSTLNSHRQ